MRSARIRHIELGQMTSGRRISLTSIGRAMVSARNFMAALTVGPPVYSLIESINAANSRSSVMAGR